MKFFSQRILSVLKLSNNIVVTIDDGFASSTTSTGTVRMIEFCLVTAVEIC